MISTNRVLDFKSEHRVAMMLDKLEPKIKLSDVKINKVFQFAGDRDRVRKVIDVDGEYVRVRTYGDTNEPRFYLVHYTQLRPNKSSAWNNELDEE